MCKDRIKIKMKSQVAAKLIEKNENKNESA